jgi:hypothetical protein
MNSKVKSGISRREFARRIAIASATTLVPAANGPAPAFPAVPQQSGTASRLSAESQADADARYQTILTLYGSRFSDEQKTDLRRLCNEAQPALDRIRAYHIENGDDPALYLKPLVEREKKPIAPAASQSASEAPKKP